MCICVGNLSNEVTEARLKSLLIEYGSVKRIHLSPEHQTFPGRGLGCGGNGNSGSRRDSD